MSTTLADRSCGAGATGTASALVRLADGIRGAEDQPSCATGFWRDDFGTATALFGGVSMSVTANHFADFYRFGSQAAFADSLTLSGLGTGFIRYHFAGDYFFSLGACCGGDGFVRLGEVVDTQLAPVQPPIRGFRGSVDYWTILMPFTFGAPVALSASMEVNLLALQSTVNGSARLSLLGIEVVDANGNVLKN